MISHTVRRRASVPVERLFATLVAEDVLPKILHRWGPVPAVVGTRDLTGPWDTPGSQRTVLLGDGSTAREEVLEFERPRRFHYRVDAFTSPLGRLVDHATGTFVFDDEGFEWTYSFHPVNAAAAVALRPFVRVAWARYMDRCADASIALAGYPSVVAAQLACRPATDALAFYEQAFGAVVDYRVGGDEIVAQMSIGDAVFWVADDDRPQGQASRMLLVVPDAHAAFARALAAGATEVYAVEDTHGWRLGRLADPFGHHWEIGAPLGAWPQI